MDEQDGQDRGLDLGHGGDFMKSRSLPPISVHWGRGVGWEVVANGCGLGRFWGSVGGFGAMVLGAQCWDAGKMANG